MRLRSSLVRKYVAYIVALVSCALLVSGVVGLHHAYQESKTARLNLQREKAIAAADRIETYIRTIERQIGWVRLASIEMTDLESQRLEFQKLVRHDPAIKTVSLIDRNGRMQIRVSDTIVDETGGGADMS